MMIGPMDALNGVKEIAELVKKFNDIPLQEKIVALQEKVMQLTTEQIELRAENHQLKQALDIRTTLVFKNPYYYEEGDEVPFCPACFEGEKKLRVHLEHPSRPWGNSHHQRTCNVCGKSFYDEGSRPQPKGRTVLSGGISPSYLRGYY